jgi:hypothetical protein
MVCFPTLSLSVQDLEILTSHKRETSVEDFLNYKNREQ